MAYTNRDAGITRPERSQPGIAPFIDSCMVKPRAAMPDAAATARMAEDMREAGQREGGMTTEALRLLGWTADQIERLGGRAREKAQVLSGATA